MFKFKVIKNFTLDNIYGYDKCYFIGEKGGKCNLYGPDFKPIIEGGFDSYNHSDNGFDLIFKGDKSNCITPDKKLLPKRWYPFIEKMFEDYVTFY